MKTKYGYCECGCGRKTPLAVTSNTKQKRVKGKPCHFFKGHAPRIPPPLQDINERFWSKVDVRSKDECWEWQAGFLQHPTHHYGRFKLGGRKGKGIGAHVMAYRLAFPNTPLSLDILHNCDNPKCVNPNHLEAGTHKKNMQDASLRHRFPTKLSDDGIREIRANPKKETQASLAKRFDVDQSTISYIKSGKKRSMVR